MGKIKRFAKKREMLLLRTAVILVPLVVLVVLLSQPVLAENTYVITDGQRVFTYTTVATDPREVLDEIGLELGEGDSYTTQAVEGAASITVQRAQDITVDYHGESIHVTSQGETVKELLVRLNLTVDPEDVLSHGYNTMTYNGMELRIEQILKQEQTYTVSIPHDTTYCYDPNMPEGMEAVLVEGVDGQMRCQATVTYVNGRETGRVVSSETVTQHPVAEVIARGTATVEEIDPNGMPIIGDGIIILPTGEVLTYTGTMQVLATAYHKSDAGCDDWTATMTRARVGAIAVDPRVIPYGTRMFIVSNDGVYVYGLATAEDCGGAIKGARVDLYYDTVYECNQFGRRDCTIYFLG